MGGRLKRFFIAILALLALVLDLAECTLAGHAPVTTALRLSQATACSTTPFFEKHQELLRTLAAMEARACEMVCLKYRYCQDREDENLIRLTLEWQSREMLESYLASGLHRVLTGALQVLCESPVITFHSTNAPTQGGIIYGSSPAGKA